MLPVILISEFGSEDIYNSVLEYHIQKISENIRIFSYFTSFHHTDKIYKAGAYILLHSSQFTKNSVFFVETNASEKTDCQKILLIQYDHQWILTPDNGLMGLLEKNKIRHIYYWKEFIQTSFYAKNEMLNALKKLIHGNFLIDDEFNEISYNECKKINWPSLIEKEYSNEKKLIVPLMHIDSFGNLIFLFTKQNYIEYSKIYDISIKLPLRVTIENISTHYNEINTNEQLAIFNEAGYLEIATNGDALAPLIAHKDIYSGASYSLLMTLKPKKV